MAGLQDFSDGRIDLYKVDPRKLVIVPGWNVRHKSEPDVAAHIRSIADTIKESGIKYIPALTVYANDGKLIVTDGYCRTEAALLAISEGVEVPWLPVRGEDRHSNEVDRTLSMWTRNETGLPLTPLQKAAVVKRLLDFGWTVQQVAQRTGKSLTHIQDVVSLLSAPESIKDMVSKGEVSATRAIKQVRKEGSTKAVETLTKAVKTAKKDGKTKVLGKHLPPVQEEVDHAGASEIFADSESFLAVTHLAGCSYSVSAIVTAIQQLRGGDLRK